MLGLLSWPFTALSPGFLAHGAFTHEPITAAMESWLRARSSSGSEPVWRNRFAGFRLMARSNSSSACGHQRSEGGWPKSKRYYERCIDVSNAMILVAMGANFMRRSAHSWFSKQALSELHECLSEVGGRWAHSPSSRLYRRLSLAPDRSCQLSALALIVPIGFRCRTNGIA